MLFRSRDLVDSRVYAADDGRSVIVGSADVRVLKVLGVDERAAVAYDHGALLSGMSISQARILLERITQDVPRLGPHSASREAGEHRGRYLLRGI